MRQLIFSRKVFTAGRSFGYFIKDDLIIFKRGYELFFCISHGFRVMPQVRCGFDLFCCHPRIRNTVSPKLLELRDSFWHRIKDNLISDLKVSDEYCHISYGFQVTTQKLES